MVLVPIAVISLLFTLPSAYGGETVVDTWEKTFGGEGEDMGKCVRPTPDGGYIVLGSTTSYGSGKNDIYLIKTDRSGEQLWARAYGGGDNEMGRSVRVVSGGYILTGSTSSFGAGKSDVYLVHLDPEGTTNWTRTFGGKWLDSGEDVAEVPGGGYVVAGYTYPTKKKNKDALLIRVDRDGNKLWEQTYGGKKADSLCSVLPTADRGFLALGNTYSRGAADNDLWVIKTDGAGGKAWSRTYGGKQYDCGNCVTGTPDGYLLAGGTISVGAGSSDAYLVKIDGAGRPAWARTFGGTQLDLGMGVCAVPGDGSLLVGNTDSVGNGGTDIYLARVDRTGETVWTRTIGYDADDFGYGVVRSPDGGFVVVGSTYSLGAGKSDIYLAKTDANGVIKN